jgi:AcrR family transcriptional regulator
MPRYEDADRSEERRALQLRGARQGIMLAAARVVSQAGYQATTMRTIAKEAGYTASSLYTYFKSKEEIFRALRDDLVNRVQSTLQEEVPPGLDFPGRVAVLAHRMGRLTDEFQDALAMHIMGGVDLPDEDGAMRMEKMRRIGALFVDWFRTNASPEELCGHSPEDVAALFHGLHKAFLERAFLCGDGAFDQASIKQSSARAQAFFLAALRAPLPAE